VERLERPIRKTPLVRVKLGVSKQVAPLAPAINPRLQIRVNASSATNRSAHPTSPAQHANGTPQHDPQRLRLVGWRLLLRRRHYSALHERVALHPTHTRNDPQGAQPHQRKEDSMTTAQLPERTGCARWIGPWPDVTRATPKDIQTAIERGKWCNSTDGLVEYQAGPLCPEHQP
jgi:hypothetical protein